MQSKFNELVAFIACLSKKNIFIDVIALQEVWAVPYPESVSIPGYQNIHRGCGVGFYVRDNIECEKMQNFSPFHEKIFESLSIKIKFGKNKFIITNVYRPPNTPQNFSISDALTAFLSDLDQLLNDISVLGLSSFVVLDANLNLLTENSTNIDYIDTIMSNGYLQLISKATRIQGNSISSIDHILTNSLQSTHDVGTLINDTNF